MTGTVERIPLSPRLFSLFGLMRHDATETFRFDTYFVTQAGKRMTAESAVHPGIAYLVPQATIDRDVSPFFARGIADRGSLAVIAALPWAKGLEHIPSNSPAGTGGVPAFIEYRTPQQ
ncbi:MAG TPA: hypothetical protein VIC60_07195 [Thermomicrobiales bacterium]